MTVDALYACFTDDELERLQQIKCDPHWTPNSQIIRNEELHTEDYKQLNVYIKARLHARLKQRCDELGISIREYMNAVLEVMLS